jgi:enamine deaminase RidA (YjgF/YER057c/UK114 family)
MTISKEILVRNDPVDGLAGLVRAGPFLFTSGCDGHRGPEGNAIVPELAGEAEAQCENAYGRIRRLLNNAKADLPAVVRLDHVTSSQDWLPRRQSVRQRFFGRPAPLASTGVAAKMEGINMLTASVIAVADPSDKEVLVSGSRYGMHNISSVVRGGPFLFISGIRGTIDPRSGRAVSEETPESFGAQTRMSYEIISAILGEIEVDASRILRLDCYIRDINRAGEEVAIRTEVFGNPSCASTVVGLPLGARGEVEITAIALAPRCEKRVLEVGNGGSLPSVIGAEGFLFVGECRADRNLPGDRAGQLESALSVLDAGLQRAGSGLSRTVRLELYLRDIHFSQAANVILRRRFRDNPPVVSVMGAELEGVLEAKLNAIAV